MSTTHKRMLRLARTLRRKTKHGKTFVVAAARAMLVKCNPVGATKADAPDAAAAAKKQRAMQRQPIVPNTLITNVI